MTRHAVDTRAFFAIGWSDQQTRISRSNCSVRVRPRALGCSQRDDCIAF